MESLPEFLEALGAAGIAAFWLPVCLWTLAALPAFVLLRAWTKAHPLVRYGAHLALLLALPAGLALVAAFDFAALWTWSPAAAAGLEAGVPLALGAAGPAPAAAPFPVALRYAAGLLTAAALVLAAWRLIRLAAHTASVRRFRRTLGDSDPALEQRAAVLARRLRIRRTVRVVPTACEAVPFTFGWRRPVIVVPAALAGDAERLAMVLAHELVHVRRHDYAWQWVEQLVGAVFAVHPLVGVLRRAVGRYREMACDAEVLARTRCDRQRYARLLYQYVLPPRAPVAVGLAASNHDLKTRLLAMQTYTERPGRLRPLPLAFAVAALLLGLSLFAVACTDVIDVNVSTGDARLDAAASDEPFIAAEQAPELVGGMAALQREIHYPQLARLAGIEGRVLVEVVVDEAGRVAEAVVKQGIGGGCDEEALRAASNATFIPARHEGVPVKMKVVIPFTFRLAPEQPAAPTTSLRETPEASKNLVTARMLTELERREREC